MANFNLNKVILGGRLTADPELKTTPGGTHVTSFSLAVGRRVKSEGQPESDFINVTAWRGTAEFITRYFRKGSAICITGSIQTRSWTDQNGNKRYATEVVAEEAYFVDSKSEGTVQTTAPAYGAPQYTAPQGYATPQSVPQRPREEAPVQCQIPQGYTYMPESYQAQKAPSFEDITDDDDLPF